MNNEGLRRRCAIASGKTQIGRLMRDIFLAGEKAHQRSAFLRSVIANRPAQHRILRFQRVENGARRDRLRSDVQLHLVAPPAPACRR